MLRVLATVLGLVLAPVAAIPLDKPSASPSPGDAPAAPMTWTPAWDPPSRLPEPSVIHLDASYLPATTGWFLAPISAGGFGSVEIRVETTWHGEGGAPGGFAVVFGHADAPFTTADHLLVARYHHAAIHATDRTAACCHLAPLTGSWVHYESEPHQYLDFVEPGSPLWVGLIAVGWHEGSRLSVTITSHETPLHLGAVHTGLDARAIDLVERARARGTNAELDGRLVAGRLADARVDLEPKAVALVHVTYEARGAASGLVSVRQGKERWLDEEYVQEDGGHLRLAGTGPLVLALTNPHEPALKARDASDHLHVVALYADVDVPFRMVERPWGPETVWR